MGKNRIKRIEGLETLIRLEVLDLHGNQISHINGLSTLDLLKVLNLAGNQIRNIGASDLTGLSSLQEFNLRRNRLKRLLGFGDTPSLQKLFLSNNELQTVEDICSLAKATNIKEIAIDNNPISLAGDCVSFLVSYLPILAILNSMQITDQVRKAAMAWRRNKENSNTAFMDLTSDVCLNIRREEVISNARTNWELLRSQTRCLTTTTSNVVNVSKNLKPDSDFILTSLAKPVALNKTRSSSKIPILPDKKLGIVRTLSQDTENSQNTSSSNTCSSEIFRLPPILVPIINKMDQRIEALTSDTSVKLSESLSSTGPNVNSPVSSLLSHSDSDTSETDTNESGTNVEQKEEIVIQIRDEAFVQNSCQDASNLVELPGVDLKITGSVINSSTDTSSNISSNTTASNESTPSVASNSKTTTPVAAKCGRSVKSAINVRTQSKIKNRPATGKVRKDKSPQQVSIEKDREQGGDYLIEICGRYLNIYGQSALRFIDKPWNPSKAKDVTTVHFNYANFNGIIGILNKLKHRFPNVDHFTFKNTNIQYLGQLNALAELQGLSSLDIDDEGNPVTTKEWINYAIYRLSHWGLRFTNGREITEQDIQNANKEYQSLSDIVLWSLPNVLLQPLLVRLQLDVGQKSAEQNAKKWLLSADPALRNVVIKESLQWKKGTNSQEDLQLKQKTKLHISNILGATCNAVNKLRLLDSEWPGILHESVRNILLDYTHMDMYMKKKLQELK